MSTKYLLIGTNKGTDQFAVITDEDDFVDTRPSHLGFVGSDGNLTEEDNTLVVLTNMWE